MANYGSPPLRKDSSRIRTALGAGVVAALFAVGAATGGGVVAAAASAAQTSAAPAAAVPFATNPNICWTQTEGDRAGDASTLDLASATLQYDCVSKLLTVSARTVAPFATPAVHDFFGAFDTDNNAATGCGGADLYADAAWVPARNEMLAALVTRTSCTSDPTFKQWLVPKRSDAYHLSLSFSPAKYLPHLSSFNWDVNIAPDPDNFDVVGNGNLFHASIPVFPPSGSSAFSVHSPSQIGGSFTSIIPGKFAGNGATDLLLYRAGSGADALWTNDGTGHFTGKPLRISGAYNQIVPGDFNHDGHTDLLFYLAGSGADFIWYSNGAGGFTSHPFRINGYYVIVPGDYNGDGYTDLLFYGPGTAPDYIWTFHSGGYTSHAVRINGLYSITPADLTGDGRTDLLFYAAGPAPDYVWNAHAVGSGVQFGSHAYPINGAYTGVYAGDFDGNGHADLFFWSRGWGRDSMLRGTASPPFLAKGSQIVINEPYDTVVVGDFNNDGRADLFLVRYGSGADELWEGK